jgi:hypothetical protein
MRDHLTYATLAGRRRWRRYLRAAALILVVMSVLFGWAGWQRVQAWMAHAKSETAPTDEDIWLAASSSPNKAASTPSSEKCPTDPGSWGLFDVYPDDNYKRIEPACVYQELARTVAWHMLERFGYTKSEAAELLGFSVLPWQPSQSIKGLTNTQGPMLIPVDMEWAPHPVYRTWLVDADGQPALAYSLRGCYRARTVVGSSVESWGAYPVICVVAYDRIPGWTVNELGKHRFAVDLTTASTQRRFVLFGYLNEAWVLLGEASDWQKVIQDPSAAGGERDDVTARYNTIPWDATWLKAAFGYEMRPLPDGWRKLGADLDAIETIVDELDQALWEFGGVP